MYQISTSPFAFVRFNDQQSMIKTDWRVDQIPGAELGFILPVNVESDFAFQIVVDTDTPVEADNLCAIDLAHGGLLIVAGDQTKMELTFAEVQALTGQPNTIFENNRDIGIGRYRVSDTRIVYYYPRLPDMTGFPCDRCFQLVFSLSLVTDVGNSFSSNVFINRCDDTDFTSVIDYYSEHDEAGFLYCIPDVKNRVRLPVYLCHPTYPDDEEIHRASDGSTRIRRSNVREVYDVVTDLFSAWAIRSFRAIFIHDFVFVEDAPELPQTMPYIGRIAKTGTYEPQYVPYKNYPIAPIQMKVEAIDFTLNKNNCGICGDYDDMLSTVDTNIGDITPLSIYNIDLTPFVSGCCTPRTFSVDYYQVNYITTINITGTTLNIGTAATLTPTPLYPPPFARVKVECGGVTKFINIGSNLS